MQSPLEYGIVKKLLNEQGSLAQLGEHLPYKQRVIGSSPITSTKKLHESGVFSCDSMVSVSEQWKATRFCEVKLKNLNMILADIYNFHHYKKAQKMCLILLTNNFANLIAL